MYLTYLRSLIYDPNTSYFINVTIILLINCTLYFDKLINNPTFISLYQIISVKTINQYELYIHTLNLIRNVIQETEVLHMHMLQVKETCTILCSYQDVAGNIHLK